MFKFLTLASVLLAAIPPQPQPPPGCRMIMIDGFLPIFSMIPRLPFL